jgi:hypothetical protein
MNRFDYKAIFSEGSTWAGLATMSAMFGANIAPQMWVNIATAVSGLLAVFIPDKGAKPVDNSNGVAK